MWRPPPRVLVRYPLGWAIHCRLIAGIDDGPKDDQQTRALIDAARSTGIAAIVSTPHFSSRYGLDSNDRDARLAAAESMAEDTPLLFAGCELELSEERLQQFFEDPRRYTLNGSRYVLVELPHNAGGASVDRATRLFGERDLTPILTQPERYPFLPPDSPSRAAWIANGGLLQATASFTGRMGRRAKAAVYELLAREALHVVASDASWTRTRPESPSQED